MKKLLLVSAITACLGVSPQVLAADASAELLQQVQLLSQQVKQLQNEVNTLKKEKTATTQTTVATSTLTNKTADNFDEKVRIRVLERKMELADEEAVKQKIEAPIVTASDKGFGIKSADGAYEIKFKGLIQEDFRFFKEGVKGIPPAPPALASGATDNYLTRRIRPTIEGTLDRIYDFKITSDFANGQTKLIDGYLDARFDPSAKLRVGKFIPPLGLERLQSSSEVKFVELALTSDMIPSRDMGTQIHGNLFNNTLNYAVGTFDGAVDGSDGDNDASNDKDVEARLFAQPFTNSQGILKGLGFGVATSQDSVTGLTTNTELPTYKTPAQENFFTYRTNTSATNTVIADGDHNRLIPQFSYYYQSFGLTGEYVKEKQTVTSINGATMRGDELNNKAWQLSTSFLLTGEEASNKIPTPNNKFDLATGGWGAWEILARVHELSVDKDAFEVNGVLPATVNNSFADPRRSAQEAHAVGVGVNWYPNKNIKISSGYEHTTFKWGGGGTVIAPLDRQDENVIILRTQATF